MKCLSAFSGCGWAYGFTLTPLPPQILPQTWKSWLKSFLMQVCKPCHYALFEAVEPSFKLHLMTTSYIYEVFECLLRLWMGIWLHTHIHTTTDACPDLWELGEILPDASVQIVPLHFGWGCRMDIQPPKTINSALHCKDELSVFWALSGSTLSMTLVPQDISHSSKAQKSPWKQMGWCQRCKHATPQTPKMLTIS
jgi:hypothetical protein